MAAGGVAAWLVPGEWMDVNYGAALRHYLGSHVTLLRLHRFEAADLQFGDALVSSCVVVFRKEEPGRGARCELTAGSSLDRPARRTRVAVEELERHPKWSHFLPGGAAPRLRAVGPATPLGDLFEVKRGIATGGNSFFIRPRAEFRALGIAERFLRPVLPSPRHLQQPIISRRPDGYPDVEEPLALLDCTLPAARIRASFPALGRYLDSAEGQHVREGYLARGRSPWYAQERRATAPILVTYMGRGRDGGSPFRFFWNRSEATATNVYLLLIPRAPVAEALRADPQRGREVLDFLEASLVELLGRGRVYGGGLHKLEPRELAGLDAARLAARLLPG
jgi:hypothetical protein